MAVIALLTILFLSAACGVWRFAGNKTSNISERVHTSNRWLAVCLLAASAGKLCLSGTVWGHTADMSLFSAWADIAKQGSLRDYYGAVGQAVYVDYPPVYLYILYGIGKLMGALHIAYGSFWYGALLKLPAVMADAVSVVLVYYVAKKKTDNITATFLGCLVFLCPVYTLDSVFWGQIDSLFTLVIAVCMLCVFKKRYFCGVLLFFVGFMLKPQMILFLPVIGMFFLKDVITEKNMRLFLKGVCGLVCGGMLFCLMFFPFVGWDMHRALEVYTKALGQYPYCSLNAANLFGMFGKNWVSDGGTVFGISYRAAGMLGIVLVSLATCAGIIRTKNRQDVFFLAAFQVFGVFLVGPGMHERYLFPAVMLLFLAFCYTKDCRMYWLAILVSAVSFVNIGLILLEDWEVFFCSDEGFCALSAVHVALFVYMVCVGVGSIVQEKSAEWPTAKPRLVLPSATIPFLHLQKGEVFLMLALTVLYGFGAFFRLGALSVPTNGYRVCANDEIVLRLDHETEIERMNLRLGWIDRRTSDAEVLRELEIVFCANDRQQTVYKTVDSVFSWDGFYAGEVADTVLIRADEGDFYIDEIALFADTETLLPVAAVAARGADAQTLCDEQDMAVYSYTWYENAYFDEIYHPRTAYEYLEGIHPYENTHPPLGKWIIAMGMLLFGKTPFGWRFFGTLSGVLAVPVFYVFAKQILKDKRFTFLAALLYTFDFMHLSQTRLATIDSFTMFFSMLSYLFMYRYLCYNDYTDGVKKTLPSLFFSGLFFGIGAAVKWQGIYGGVGLFAMFVYCRYRRYVEYKSVMRGNFVGAGEHIRKTFRKNFAASVLAAGVFFVLIPVVIYALSYLPLILSDSVSSDYLFTNQASMLDYHGGLTERHPYGSSWWSWPLDYRPLYAYNPNRDFVAPDRAQGITTFGNPLLWWLTLPVMLYLLARAIQGKGNRKTYTVLIGFFAFFAPWIFISRQAFIYHFFPCVPFVALGVGLCMKPFTKRFSNGLVGLYGYCGAAVLLYLLYYPVLTGLEIPLWFADFLSVFPTWVLG